MGRSIRFRDKKRRVRAHARAPLPAFTIAGPVTIKRQDGTVEVQPALTPEEQQRLIHLRSVTASQRQAVLRRDGHRCRYCGSTEDLQIDHVVPIALGGSNRTGNLVTACRQCNARKGPQVWKPRPVDKHQRSQAKDGASSGHVAHAGKAPGLRAPATTP